MAVLESELLPEYDVIELVLPGVEGLFRAAIGGVGFSGENQALRTGSIKCTDHVVEHAVVILVIAVSKTEGGVSQVGKAHFGTRFLMQPFPEARGVVAWVTFAKC
jgi:hypothetical protein